MRVLILSTCTAPPKETRLFPSLSKGPRQGLTLVHVRAQLEHIWDTFMGQFGFRGAQRQLKLS
jgi:hypothetical protein